MKLAVLLLFLLFTSKGFAQPDSLRTQDIEAVELSFSRQKEIAYKDPKYYILDFHVGKKGNFLLMNRFKKHYIYSLDYNMEVKDIRELNFTPRSFYKDCSGLLHILSRDSIYQIEVLEEQIAIYQRNPISLYKNFYIDCVAKNDSTTIFKRELNFGKTQIYYGIKNSKQDRNILYRIEDPKIVRSVLEERGEIDMLGGRERFDREAFFKQVITYPEFNPLFVRDDTTYIFDHLNGEVVQMSDTGEVYETKSIDYHTLKNWKKEIQFDESRGKFYVVHLENGTHVYSYLDLEDCTTESGTKLTKHAYPRKVIIYNGFAYYLYREFVDDNLNKLFRQRI